MWAYCKPDNQTDTLTHHKPHWHKHQCPSLRLPVIKQGYNSHFSPTNKTNRKWRRQSQSDNLCPVIMLYEGLVGICSLKHSQQWPLLGFREILILRHNDSYPPVLTIHVWRGIVLTQQVSFEPQELYHYPTTDILQRIWMSLHDRQSVLSACLNSIRLFRLELL